MVKIINRYTPWCQTPKNEATEKVLGTVHVISNENKTTTYGIFNVGL